VDHQPQFIQEFALSGAETQETTWLSGASSLSHPARTSIVNIIAAVVGILRVSESLPATLDASGENKVFYPALPAGDVDAHMDNVLAPYIFRSDDSQTWAATLKVEEARLLHGTRLPASTGVLGILAHRRTEVTRWRQHVAAAVNLVSAYWVKDSEPCQLQPSAGSTAHEVCAAREV
jgi:hypothetical protein